MALAKTLIKDYGVYDKSVPEDQMCDLRFAGIVIKSFNGVAVDWEKDNSWINKTATSSRDAKSGSEGNAGRIKVPAGVNTIVLDWVQQITKYEDSRQSGNTITTTYTTTTSSLRNITLSNVEMLPGHNYFIGGGMGTDKKIRVWLLDQTNTPIGFYGDNVAKAPRKSKTPTQFEGTWKNTYGESFAFAGNTWLQTMPPFTGQNTGPNKLELRGTFVSDGETLTLYAIDTAASGGMWLDISGMRQAYIYKYSFNANTLLLELPYQLPELVYRKQ
jgi:hypothetical protein